MGMSSYSEEFVCVPYPNNFMWLPVVFLQFIVVFAGCYSHCVFQSLVVFPQKFGNYLRISFGLISTMMLTMLLTSTGAFLITLTHGKLIEDCEISGIEIRQYLLYVHSFGEYFFVVCELLGTIERVTSTFSRRFRKSDFFSTVFAVGCLLGVFASLVYIYFVRISFKKDLFAIGFGSLTLMEILNGIIVFALLFAAKKKYRTDQEASLNTRYEISLSYAYSRCAAASVTARVFIIAYVYLKLAGFFDGDMDSGFFYVMNLFINFYCVVYPWSIMLYHRQIKRQISHMLNQTALLRHKKIKQDGIPKTLYTIDGKQMNGMTTEDHFQQLNNFWNISPSPSPKLS